MKALPVLRVFMVYSAVVLVACGKQEINCSEYSRWSSDHFDPSAKGEITQSTAMWAIKQDVMEFLESRIPRTIRSDFDINVKSHFAKNDPQDAEACLIRLYYDIYHHSGILFESTLIEGEEVADYKASAKLLDGTEKFRVGFTPAQLEAMFAPLLAFSAQTEPWTEPKVNRYTSDSVTWDDVAPKRPSGLSCKQEMKGSYLKKYVLYTVEGKTYGVNGSARTAGYPDFRKSSLGGWANINELIKKGLALCSR